MDLILQIQNTINNYYSQHKHYKSRASLSVINIVKLDKFANNLMCIQLMALKVSLVLHKLCLKKVN